MENALFINILLFIEIFYTQSYLNQYRSFLLILWQIKSKRIASCEVWTHDPWFTRPVLCHWAIEATLSTIDISKLFFNNINNIKVSRNLRIVSPGYVNYKVHSGTRTRTPQIHPYTYMIYRAFRQLSYWCRHYFVLKFIYVKYFYCL